MGLLVIEHIDRLPAVVSLPGGYETGSGPWPILCFLHGSKEAAPCEIHEALTRHGPLRAESSQRIIDTFIVVAPQLPQPGGDVWGEHAQAVRQLVTALESEHGGDPNRRYLTGFSYGANGVFDLGVGDFWAALWPVDPTRVPQIRPSTPVWLSLGDHSRISYREFLRRYDFRPADNDPDSNFVYVDDGKDHVESARLAYRDDNSLAFNWLTKRQPGGLT